jgi:predicted nucleotidyltransferase
MPESLPESPLEKVAKILLSHGVEFIVIGGQAELAYGSPRPTVDVDLCYRRTGDNLRRLADALRELKPTLRNAPPELPFIIDARTLELGNNFTFTTSVVDLDLLGWVEPLGDYENVARRALKMTVGNMELQIIDLEDLIRIKQHIGRPKDRESLSQLLAIKRVRDEQSQ